MLQVYLYCLVWLVELGRCVENVKLRLHDPSRRAACSWVISAASVPPHVVDRAADEDVASVCPRGVSVGALAVVCSLAGGCTAGRVWGRRVCRSDGGASEHCCEGAARAPHARDRIFATRATSSFCVRQMRRHRRPRQRLPRSPRWRWPAWRSACPASATGPS